MGIGDVLLIIFIPPLASGVRERGCGTVFLVFLLWCIFWIPGSIAALIMTLNKPTPPVCPGGECVHAATAPYSGVI